MYGGRMNAAESIGAGSEEWVQAHEALSRLCLRRAEFDADEGKWLLRAFRAATHAHLGFASFGEYVERLFGLGRRATEEKLRVATALEELPELERALRTGSLNWSTVREVTRVARAHTEREWLSAVSGKTVREVEQLVSGLAPGDRPKDPRRAERLRHVLRFEVGAETLATFREAMRLIQKRSEHRLNDDEALLSMAREILGGPREAGRASYQVVVTQCEDCRRGFQHANGELIQLDPAIVEMCDCDAQRVVIAPARTARIGVEAGADGERLTSDGHVDGDGNGVVSNCHVGERVHIHVDADGNGVVSNCHVGADGEGIEGIVAPSAGGRGVLCGCARVDADGEVSQGDALVHANSGAVKSDVRSCVSGRAAGSDGQVRAHGEAKCAAHVGSTDERASSAERAANGDLSAARRAGSEAPDERLTGRGGRKGLKRLRATRETPPAVRREVFFRDRGCCVVPGCRNATYVDLHHLELRSEGGSEDPDNLVVLCGAHHGALHRGRLRIDGKVSGGLRFRHADGTVYGFMPSPALADASAKAFAGLRGLGFSERTARVVLDRALDGAPAEASAEALLRSAIAHANHC